MAIAASDVIPLSQARANLSELASEVKAGAEKMITKNGEKYVALTDADSLDYYHRLERKRSNFVLLDDITKVLQILQWKGGSDATVEDRIARILALQNQPEAK
jgi:prevent-host-death family protein